MRFGSIFGGGNSSLEGLLAHAGPPPDAPHGRAEARKGVVKGHGCSGLAALMFGKK